MNTQVYTLNTQMTEVQNTTETITNNVKQLETSFDNKLEVLR